MARRKKNSNANDTSDKAKTKMVGIQRDLLAEANRKVTIQANGKSEEITISEVLSRKLIQVASQGSPHALNHAIRALAEAQQLRAEEIADEVELGKKFKQVQQRLLDDAIKDGNDINTVLPHPDDIVIIEDEGFRVHGPLDEEQFESTLATCCYRDALIYQYALEQRLPFTPLPLDEFGQEPKGNFPGASALLEVFVWNGRLPKRFQMDDAEIMWKSDRLSRHSKRELLKLTHAKWKETGYPKPRGFISLPPDLTMINLKALASFTKINREVKDSDSDEYDRLIHSEIQRFRDSVVATIETYSDETKDRLTANMPR